MTAQSTKPKRAKKQQVKQKLPPKTLAMVAMRQAGMTYEDIGKEVNLSKATTWRYINKITPELQEYQDIKANLPDQFAKACIDNLNLNSKINNALLRIPDDDLDKMNPVNLAAIKRTVEVGYGIAHDHYRTESGQSNTNIAILVDTLRAVKAEEV